jgi:hypothetical protein
MCKIIARVWLGKGKVEDKKREDSTFGHRKLYKLMMGQGFDHRWRRSIFMRLISYATVISIPNQHPCLVSAPHAYLVSSYWTVILNKIHNKLSYHGPCLSMNMFSSRQHSFHFQCHIFFQLNLYITQECFIIM